VERNPRLDATYADASGHGAPDESWAIREQSQESLDVLVEG